MFFSLGFQPKMLVWLLRQVRSRQRLVVPLPHFTRAGVNTASLPHRRLSSDPLLRCRLESRPKDPLVCADDTAQGRCPSSALQSRPAAHLRELLGITRCKREVPLVRDHFLLQHRGSPGRLQATSSGCTEMRLPTAS